MQRLLVRVFLALGLVAAAAAAVNVCTEYESLVPELKEMNYDPGPWFNVFTSYDIQKAGRLTKWAYFAARPGEVYLDIWRRTNDGRLELVGFNKVVCEGPGLRTFAVPCEDQIQVQVGDMFGVHYPKSAEAQAEGVVWYEDSRYPPLTFDDDSHMSSIVSMAKFDDTLFEGFTMPEQNIADFRRSVALAATIN